MALSIGTIKGIKVTIDWSVGMMVGLLCMVELLLMPSRSIMIALFSAIMRSVIIYGSVIVHEIGHIVMAKRYGYEVESVNIHALGGMTIIHGAAIGWQELVVIFWGPACSLALGLLGGVIYLFYSDALGLIQYFFALNLVLFIFNILPAIPLDGGRMLRAICCKWFDYLQSTKIAMCVTWVICVGLIVISVLMIEHVRYSVLLIVTFVGYLLYGARNEMDQAREIQELLDDEAMV